MRQNNRLVFPSILIAGFLLILGVSGAWYVHRLQKKHSNILDVNVESIRAAEELEIYVREMRYELNSFLLSGDREHVAAALAKEPQVRYWVERAESLAVTLPEVQYMAAIKEDLNGFFVLLHEEVERTPTPMSTEIIKSLVDGVLTDRVVANAEKYLNVNEAELHASNVQNREMAHRLAIALLLLGTCGAIAGLVAGYGVARGISRSALQLSVPIRDVAGKLNEIVGPVDISADPSLDDLEAVLQAVSDQVGEVVEQLHARHREVIRADQLAAVGQLAAGLAHELRNPLMCMKTLVQSAWRRRT